jgi:hypothetical protein
MLVLIDNFDELIYDRNMKNKIDHEIHVFNGWMDGWMDGWIDGSMDR